MIFMSNWFWGPIVGHDESFRTFTPPLALPPRLARPVFSILIKTMTWKRSHTSLLAQLAFVPFEFPCSSPLRTTNAGALFPISINVKSCSTFQLYLSTGHIEGVKTQSGHFPSFQVGSAQFGCSGVVRTQGHVPRLLPLLLAR